MTEEYFRLLVQEKELLEMIMDNALHSGSRKATLMRQMMVDAEIEDLMFPKKKTVAG